MIARVKSNQPSYQESLRKESGRNRVFGGAVWGVSGKLLKWQSVINLACIIREGTAEGILGDMRSPKALLAA